MPGLVVTFTYKRKSHINHRKNPKVPQEEIGQDFRASKDIACASRNVTDLTRTPADLREHWQRTLYAAMISLKGFANEGRLQQQTRKAPGSHKLRILDKTTKSAASGRFHHFTSRGRMLRWHYLHTHRRTSRSSGMRSYKNGCSKKKIGDRPLYRSPQPWSKSKKDHDCLDLAAEDSDQPSAQKCFEQRALYNAFSIETPRCNKLTAAAFCVQ